MARAWLRARHVATGGATHSPGAILVDDDGRVAAVGPEHVVTAPPGCPVYDYGEAVIIPGLTNCHTHLELTGLNGGRALDEPHFPTWIRRLRELKAQRTREDFLGAAREGIRQCFRQGVTTIADTGDTGTVAQAMAELGMRGTCYQEVFGPDPVLVRESMRMLEDAVEALAPWRSERVRVGVSPHAPYTVSGPLYREAARWARARQLPLAVHIAESADESALLANASGAFADAWRRRSLPMPEPLGLTPVSYLSHWGLWDEDPAPDALAPADVLAIHAIRVPWDDVHMLAAGRVMVAWCPLANRAHGHGDAPIVDYLEKDIRVGLGTDSELSVGPIDLLEAGRAAAGLAGRPVLEMVLRLIFAGRDLPGGRDEEGNPCTGEIDVGLDADLAVFACPSDLDHLEAPLTEGAGGVLATWAGGVEVYRREVDGS